MRTASENPAQSRLIEPPTCTRPNEPKPRLEDLFRLDRLRSRETFEAKARARLARNVAGRLRETRKSYSSIGILTP